MNLSLHLNVYNHIVSNGEKQAESYVLGELSAWHDFDGYTCYIGYKDLVMTLYFHSRFSYEYEDDATYRDFSLLIESIQSDL